MPEATASSFVFGKWLIQRPGVGSAVDPWLDSAVFDGMLKTS